MFCAGCGTQIQSGLNYCSRCGRRVAESENAETFAKTLASSLGYIGGFGFLGYIFVALVFVKNGVPPTYLVPITFFYFASLFGICYLILRQTELFRRRDTRRDDVQIRNDQPSYLKPVTTAQLREGFDEPASVTDHTTRTLEEVPMRKS
jgi:hypothetical protein